MIPAWFEYATPKTIPEAIELLDKNKDTKIFSGGHSLIPQMQFRFANTSFLIRIKSPAGLDIGAVTPNEIVAELIQVHRQYIAPRAAEFAQAVAAAESIVSSEAIHPICDTTVQTATARYV